MTFDVFFFLSSFFFLLSCVYFLSVPQDSCVDQLISARSSSASDPVKRATTGHVVAVRQLIGQISRAGMCNRISDWLDLLR